MVFQTIVNIFQSIIDFISEPYKSLFVILLYTFFIVGYSLFIWKFYRFLSARDVLWLNLGQYNYSTHPILEKIFATILYIVEYMIILPFLVLFWFVILSVFLLLLSKADVQQTLMISAAVIASIRITSYVSEELSKDVAKILPFTILAIFIISADLFDIERLLKGILEIPSLFSQIFIFVVFIFLVEFILRAIYLVTQFFGSEEDRKERGK